MIVICKKNVKNATRVVEVANLLIKIHVGLVMKHEFYKKKHVFVNRNFLTVLKITQNTHSSLLKELMIQVLAGLFFVIPMVGHCHIK